MNRVEHSTSAQSTFALDADGLTDRLHTRVRAFSKDHTVTAPISNGPTTHGYTTMRDATENVWVDKNLITANSAAGLGWAKAILEYLDVYPVETINTWCQYYSTGNPEFFFKLMAN